MMTLINSKFPNFKSYPQEGEHHRLQAARGRRQPEPGHLRDGEPLFGRGGAAGTARRTVLLQGTS